MLQKSAFLSAACEGLKPPAEGVKHAAPLFCTRPNTLARPSRSSLRLMSSIQFAPASAAQVNFCAPSTLLTLLVAPRLYCQTFLRV
ncbi:hypothetical protein D3C86_1914120 [compost metagenome]